LIEWGTEPNGEWFSWNGKWNGGAGEGPARYVAAYRHIVDLMRADRADNLQWVWHVNWLDEPEKIGIVSRIIFQVETIATGRSQCLWTNHANDARWHRELGV